MRRALLLVFLLLPVLGVSQASAWQETYDPPAAANPASIVVLDTALLGIGEFLPADPLVVTDEELAGAGAAETLLVLIDDPNLLIVDDDLAQCPNAQFTTINSAVLAAAPGNTIRVCPGEYKEAVLIPFTKAGLTLQAPRHQGQATECQRSTTPDPTREAILEYNASLNGGNPSVGFQVEANGVTIEGFTVQPDPLQVAANGVGIFTSRFFTDYEIAHNVVQNNTIGIYVNNNVSGEAVVRQNCLRENNLPGAASGNGVYSDQGLHNARIHDNYFTGHDNASVVIDTFLSTPSNIDIVHNEAVDDSTIVVFNSTNVHVRYNKIVRPDGSGIVMFVNTNVEASYNHLEAVVGAGDGSANGISIGFNTGVLVKSNKIMGFDVNGLRLGNQDNGVVRENWIQDNAGSGIRVHDDSDTNTIHGNLIVNNGTAGADTTDGIRIEPGSSGNTIENNRLRGNVTHDCHDSPPLDNVWSHNVGNTEDTAGICKKKP